MIAHVWGAHAYSVLVKAFCLHELSNCVYALTRKRKVCCRKMRATSTLQARAPRNAVDGSSL